MKTLSWILILLACLPAFGAQSVLVVTNTKAGVTAISKSNYPTVTLKDFPTSQFGTNTGLNFIRPGATVTNFNVVSNFTLLSLGTNLVLATDASGNVIGTVVSGGGSGLTNTYNPAQFTLLGGTNVNVAIGGLFTNLELWSPRILGDFTNGPFSPGLYNSYFYSAITLYSSFNTKDVHILTTGRLLFDDVPAGELVAIWSNQELKWSSVTTNELFQLTGATGNIQTNLDNRTPQAFSNGTSNTLAAVLITTNMLAGNANTLSNRVNTLDARTNIYDTMSFNLSNGGSALAVGADAIKTLKTKFVVHGWNIICRPTSSTLSLGIKVTNTIPTLAANLVSSGNNPGVTNTLSASNSVPTWSYTNWAVNDTVGYEVTIVTGATNATVEVYGFKIP